MQIADPRGNNKKKITPPEMNPHSPTHQVNKNKTIHLKKHLKTSWGFGMWIVRLNLHLMMDPLICYTLELLLKT